MTFNFLPKCKICGERHRIGQCGVIDGNAQKPELVGSRPEAAPAQAEDARGVGTIDAAQDQGRAAPAPAQVRREHDATTGETYTRDLATGECYQRPKFDRNAYQRDLMRRRRAEKRTRLGSTL
jgi:hypothetical protein